MVTRRSKRVVIECRTREDAINVERALQQVEIQAFVSLVGALLPSGNPARGRVLEFINDVNNAGAGRVRVESREGQHQVDASKEVRP